MFKLRVKTFFTKTVLVFLILWGAASFFVFPTLDFAKWIFAPLSLISLYFVLFKRFNHFCFIITLFTNLYALYSLLFTYGLELWLLMLLLALISGFLFYNAYEDQIKDFPINLCLYLIFILEVFLALSYYLVNPMTRSIILVLLSHLFVGFLGSGESGEINAKLIHPYIYLTSAILLFLFFTISWGR